MIEQKQSGDAMPTVNQPTSIPTNKLIIASLVGPAASEVWGAVMSSSYPDLAGPAMSMLVGGIASMFAGYWVRDRPNVMDHKRDD